MVELDLQQPNPQRQRVIADPLKTGTPASKGPHLFLGGTQDTPYIRDYGLGIVEGIGLYIELLSNSDRATQAIVLHQQLDGVVGQHHTIDFERFILDQPVKEGGRTVPVSFEVAQLFSNRPVLVNHAFIGGERALKLL